MLTTSLYLESVKVSLNFVLKLVDVEGSLGKVDFSTAVLAQVVALLADVDSGHCWKRQSRGGNGVLEEGADKSYGRIDRYTSVGPLHSAPGCKQRRQQSSNDAMMSSRVLALSPFSLPSVPSAQPIHPPLPPSLISLSSQAKSKERAISRPLSPCLLLEARWQQQAKSKV